MGMGQSVLQGAQLATKQGKLVFQFLLTEKSTTSREDLVCTEPTSTQWAPATVKVLC